ncbi:MAG: divergent polysaccharide deacetylase family protein, partial [Rhodospirillaceae bacterium]
SQQVDPGPHALLTGLAPQALQANLTWSLDRFSGYVGINNHMGSRFTAAADGMDRVMAELKARGLAFLDSVTSGRSQGSRAATRAGVDFAVRNIFIDHQDDLATIRTQLGRIERLAHDQGHAIAIGHPREKTLAAIAPWLDSLEDKGFQLVPVSALLHRPGAKLADKPN